MNLNELHVPEDADDAMRWACAHELVLRALAWRLRTRTILGRVV